MKLSRSTILLIAILLLGSFFRLYQIRDYLVFLGDEGRDALVWKHILIDRQLTLLGPTASVGGFYLGPIYYYLALPFAWAFQLDPVGPAYFVAIIGIATVYLVYRFGKDYLGSSTIGLIAAFLYSFAPLTVRYSRSSWNPNPLPFFTLLGLMSLFSGIKHKRWYLLVLSGICLGIAWQLHYLALIISAIYLAIVIIEVKRINLFAIPNTLLAIFLGWLIGFSPFLAFEIRHGLPNTRTVLEFITRKNGAIHPVILDVIATALQRTLLMFRTVLSLPDTLLVKAALLLIIALGLRYCFTTKHRLLAIWFLVGMFGFAFYQGSIADYYFGFLFPVPFLILSTVIHKLRPPLLIIILLFLSTYQLSQAFFLKKPNRQVDQTIAIADQVIKFSESNPFNFALITGGNSDHAYRFFLELKGHRPLGLEEKVTDQLLIVCEKPPAECKPLGHSLWEIAGFGQSEVNAQATVNPGITIYRMTHYYGQ